MPLTYAPNNKGATIVTLARPAAPASFDNRRCHTLQRLMDASQQRLENVARTGDDAEMRVAQRILECPATFLHWEHEHTKLMRSVAATSRAQEQKRVLLSTAMALLHRKSLFEYLRDQRVHDRQRELLLMHFHGGNDYARSMVIEHGNYLRSAASYICAISLGLRLMQDARFAGPLNEYEILYVSYFSAYSKLLLSQGGTDSRLLGMVAYRLKRQLGQSRRSLLNSAPRLH